MSNYNLKIHCLPCSDCPLPKGEGTAGPDSHELKWRSLCRQTDDDSPSPVAGTIQLEEFSNHGWTRIDTDKKPRGFSTGASPNGSGRARQRLPSWPWRIRTTIMQILVFLAKSLPLWLRRKPRQVHRCPSVVRVLFPLNRSGVGKGQG